MKKKVYITVAAAVVVFMIFYIFFRPYYANYSKENYVGAKQLDEHLFYETYLISGGGVLASNTYSMYLTDSTNFRKYVGTIYSDHEHLYSELLDSNHVLIYRGNRRDRSDTLGNKKIYVISELKKEGKFE